MRDESAESLHRIHDDRIDWIQLVVNQLLPMSVDGQNSPSHLTTPDALEQVKTWNSTLMHIIQSFGTKMAESDWAQVLSILEAFAQNKNSQIRNGLGFQDMKMIMNCFAHNFSEANLVLLIGVIYQFADEASLQDSLTAAAMIDQIAFSSAILLEGNVIEAIEEKMF